MIKPSTRSAVAAAPWVVFLLAGAGCVYSASDRCGDNEVLSPDGQSCACVSGAVMTDHDCVLCGANEVPGNGVCVCATGYTRPAADAPCAPAPLALGMSCDTTSAPCTDATYSLCETSGGTAGYCTNTGCATSSDCMAGYACDTSGATPFCRRPPVGAGQACTSAADCAGTEATFCDTTVTHQCHVQGCTLSPDNCFEGTQCCDLSSFGVPQPFCVQSGTCPT